MKFDDLFDLADDALVELNRGGPRGTVLAWTGSAADARNFGFGGIVRRRAPRVRVRLVDGREVWHPVSRTHKVTP